MSLNLAYKSVQSILKNPPTVQTVLWEPHTKTAVFVSVRRIFRPINKDTRLSRRAKSELNSYKSRRTTWWFNSQFVAPPLPILLRSRSQASKIATNESLKLETI